MIYHFILNPKSGRSRKQKNLEDIIKAACQKRCLDYHIYYTTCAGDATEYVRSMLRISPEKQRFISIGGDGTLNEVANSAPMSENAEFGVIPYGSGNDFVRNFTNKELFYDVEAQLDGEAVKLDLIKYNDAYAVNMINIGFDCTAARVAAKLRRHKFVGKTFSYTLGVVKAFFSKIGTDIKIIFDDGEIISDKFTLFAFGNGCFYGGGYCALPTAKLNDSIINMCAVRKLSRFKLLRFVGSYKKGTHLEKENIRKYFTVKDVSHFKLEFPSPVPICVDGEIKGAKSVDVEILPKAFNFVIPKGSTYR